jgi:hypothetical protein
MVNPWFRNTKAIILTPLLLVLLFIVACGTTTPPTSATRTHLTRGAF